MADAMDHAPRLRGVLHLDAVADATQAERAQRVELSLVGAVGGFVLRDPHASTVSSSAAAAGAASIVSVATSSCSPRRPSTPLIDRPRNSATSSGRRRL